MNTCYVVRSSRPAGLFSFGLLDGLHVRLRRPYLGEAPAGFGLECLATAFMNNPGHAYPVSSTRTNRLWVRHPAEAHDLQPVVWSGVNRIGVILVNSP
jgi:hypothetical protein